MGSSEWWFLWCFYTFGQLIFFTRCGVAESVRVRYATTAVSIAPVHQLSWCDIDPQGTSSDFPEYPTWIRDVHTLLRNVCHTPNVFHHIHSPVSWTYIQRATDLSSSNSPSVKPSWIVHIRLCTHCINYVLYLMYIPFCSP